MVPFDSFNVARHEAFEAGLLYILRYAAEDYNQFLSDDDVVRLSSHLAEKKPWKTAPEWEEYILNNIHSKKYPLRKFPTRQEH